MSHTITRLLCILLVGTTSILSARPFFGEPDLAVVPICTHPDASKVELVAQREFLDLNIPQKRILIVRTDTKEHRNQFSRLQSWFGEDSGKDNGYDLFRVGALFATPEVIDAAYPPDSKTPYYSGDQISQKYLWRSLGWIAPDLIIIWKEADSPKIGLPESASDKLRAVGKAFPVPMEILGKTRLASALSSADPPPAKVGHIPAIELTCPEQAFLNFDTMGRSLFTHFVRQKFPPLSSAHQELLDRRKRTPAGIAEQLDKVYGHHLNKVMYQPALSLIARLNLEDLQGGTSRYEDVERIVVDYASGKKPTLGDKSSGSVTAGHLIFVELAHRVDKEKYLPLVKRAADQIFDMDGKPGPAMPAHNEMSDAVFMGGPILAAAGNLTGEEQYYELCLKHVRFMQKLCLREDGIYRHSPLDEAAWGRGNGFPALGLALVLSEIPESHPVHKELREDFRNHLKALREHQDPTGMWHQVIDEPGSYREMTSTCMISFAILRGLRNGWLDENEFRPVVERSMPAIKDRIAPNGELIDVCTGTGKQKNLQAYYDRTAILGKDERGGAMAFLAVTEYAGYLQGKQGK